MKDAAIIGVKKGSDITAAFRGADRLPKPRSPGMVFSITLGPARPPALGFGPGIWKADMSCSSPTYSYRLVGSVCGFSADS